MKGCLKNTRVEAVYAVVPSQYDDLDNYASVFGEKKISRHKKVTGIEGRFVSRHDQKSSDLVIDAAKGILDKLNWNPEEIKVLLFVTQSSPMRLPSTAFYIQKVLGVSKDCTVFDMNLGCTGNNVGIQVVSGLLNQYENGAKGLLLYSDAVYAGKEDITPDSLLFGSAGTAVALVKDETCEIPIFSFSDGERYEAIKCMHGGNTQMDGEAVFRFGINDVANDLMDFRKHFDIQETAIDFYSLHQAQKMMLDSICESADIPEEKDFRSMYKYGNTNGSSVILNLCAFADSLPQKEELTGILCGFGVGLSWCMEYISIKRDHILGVGVSDMVYDM